MVKFSQAIIVCVGLAARLACAQTLSLEDRMAVYDAQLTLLRKEADVKKALKESAGANAAGLPTVLSVNIVGGQRTVLLQMANGNEDHFREGEEVQSDMRVSSIGLKRVMVSVGHGKKMGYVALASASPQINGNPNDPNRLAQSIPNEMLPAAPVVNVPTLKSILPLPSQVNAAQVAPTAKPTK